MPHIVLIRHGQTHQNRQRIIQGQHPRLGRLTALGMAQARAVGRALAEDDFQFDRALCSPLERAALTLALALAERPGEDTLPLRFEDALREINMGKLSGRPGEVWWREARACDDPMDYAPPEGESWHDLRDRVAAFFDRELRTLAGRTLVVAHGGVIRGVLSHLTGLPMSWTPGAGGISQRNACINRITLDEAGRLVDLRIDDTRHLAGLDGQADQGPVDGGRRWDGARLLPVD